ncbi:unnamed protein product, partial [Mesorhabditis spiculigera]
MGYVLMVKLNEDLPEAEVEGILAEIASINGVERITPEWRGNRRRSNEQLARILTPSPIKTPKKTKAQSEPRGQKRKKLRRDEDEFDAKLQTVLMPRTPRKYLSPMKFNADRVPSPDAEDKENLTPELAKEEGQKAGKSETNVAPLTCKECGKVNKRWFRWHALRHYQRKLYKCKLCPHECNLIYDIRRHVSFQHVLNAEEDENYEFVMDEKFKNDWTKKAAYCFPTIADTLSREIDAELQRDS